jgi:hypothetical protein
MSVSTMEALCASRTLILYDSPSILHPLVDLGLGQVVDLLSTILDLSIGSLESAQNARALGNVVVADQLVVGNAVQCTTA